MNIIHFYILLIISIHCFAGPLEDLANMPDLALFYQQLIRQQDIQMLLQGLFPQQPAGGINDFTIFAPNNEAMTRLTRKTEDLNLLWKYHIVSGRYDEQTLANMAQEKYTLANPRQTSGIRPQNNLPTIALPFQVFYGLGFYGGTGPPVNETDNEGYGAGGIIWATGTAIKPSNAYEDTLPLNPYLMVDYHPNPRYYATHGSLYTGHPHNLTNYNNAFNSNINPQFRQNPNMPNPIYNSYLQQQPPYVPIGPNGDIGILRPTINNAFILQSRPMSRGVINVIDNILWPPERRDQTQYKTAYDALEEAQFSRLRQLAERSDYFRSELRSMHHQTWFLPNDQAFSGIGSSLSFLLDQSYINNTNEINEFIKSHVIPLVLFPTTMDSTKQVATLSPNRWITFRKISQPDQSFQIDVIEGRHVARILVARPEDIQLYGNGVVYPISGILSSQARTAADELLRSYQYFMSLVQQSGDLELINILQGTSNNMYNSQNLFNITVLIPQQTSIQPLATGPELSMNLRRHILRFPVYTDQLTPIQTIPIPFGQSNIYRSGQNQQQQPFNPQQNTYQTGQQQQQPTIRQQNIYQTGQQPQQQPLNPQQNVYQTGQQPQQQPLNPQQNVYQTGQQPQQQPLNPQQNVYQTGQQQQQPLNPQQNIYQTGQQQQQQQPLNPQQNIYQTGQQQQQQPLNPQQNMYQTGQQQPSIPQQQQPTILQQQQQQPFIQPGFNQQQQYQMPQFQRAASGSDKKQPRRRRQMNIPQNPNFQQQQIPQQQLPNQQILPIQQQQLPNPQILPTQQQQLPNQPMLPIQQQPLPNQQMLPPVPIFPSRAIFENGQVYPTLDPQFSIQAQVSGGPNGYMVTLVGRSTNSLPFTAIILNSESNIPIKNGVMHVIRGILSGTIISLEGVLSSVQGASAFTQLLQQTGIINQLKQSGRPHTLFIPTNAALQSVGMTQDVNRLRQFVLRHICADVLLDPTSNILRRSAGFYNRGQNVGQKQQQQQQRPRQKRQNWMNTQQNITNRQGLAPPDLGPNYFQPQQQVYGGYPAAPSPFSSNNQLFNPGYVMSGYVSPNSEYFPGYNGTYLGGQNFNYNNLGVPNRQIPNPSWNLTTNGPPFNPQINTGAQNFYQNTGGYLNELTYTRGPQSCIAMTGERITVRSLPGLQPEGNTPMSHQNFMVTCCSDQSVNSLVHSFNVYPPNFAVYLIGSSLLSKGQTINSLNNYTTKLLPSHLIIFFFIISLIFKEQIHHF